MRLRPQFGRGIKFYGFFLDFGKLEKFPGPFIFHNHKPIIMKSILMPLAVAALAVMSCNDAAEDTTSADTTTTTTTTTPTTETTGYVDVPASTRTSFEVRHPNASNVTWRRYAQVDRSTIEPDDWRYKLDTMDYEVSFRWNDMDYYAWYDDTSWIRTSARMTDHSQLPSAVNDVIKKNYADYTITEVEKEHDKGMVLYEVDLEKGNEKVKIHFDEKGKEVKKKKKTKS